MRKRWWKFSILPGNYRYRIVSNERSRKSSLLLSELVSLFLDMINHQSRATSAFHITIRSSALREIRFGIVMLSPSSQKSVVVANEIFYLVEKAIQE